MGRKRTGEQPRDVVVSAKVTGQTAEAIDAARGDATRSAWLAEVIAAALGHPARPRKGVLGPRKAPGPAPARDDAPEPEPAAEAAAEEFSALARRSRQARPAEPADRGPFGELWA